MDKDKQDLREGEFVPSGHFYSVVPSVSARKRYLEALEPSIDSLPGIDINREGQINLLKTLKPYFENCQFPDFKQDGKRYYFCNPAYSYGDAITLYAMMRHFAPRRIIEIGSGYSSAAMLDTNYEFFDGQIELTFIEPYPELLLSLMEGDDSRKSTVVPVGVQEIDLHLFDQLEKNDILFIDSTHVSKLGSDVNRIFFDIIPRLKPGVIIHIHDIFWPFEYPKAWIRDGRAWNEVYLLRALLQSSAGFEVLFFADYLKQIYSDWFSTNAKPFTMNSGGNFWMKKLT
jgi:predicted O-methyltransferase YrrM